MADQPPPDLLLAIETSGRPGSAALALADQARVPGRGQGHGGQAGLDGGRRADTPLRHDAALFIVPHTSKADSVPGLHGDALAIVGTSPHDAALFDVIKKEYGLTLKGDLVPMQPADVAEAIKAKTIQGVFVVAAPSGKVMSDVLAAVQGPAP